MIRPNTIGSYQKVAPFAYPGWRLTIPGQPAGGQYHGFVGNKIASATVPAANTFRAKRSKGIASHDAQSSSARHPDGVYRSSAEPPPNPTAPVNTSWSGQVQQSQGSAEAPGSFTGAQLLELAKSMFLGSYPAPEPYQFESSPPVQGGAIYRVRTPPANTYIPPSPTVYTGASVMPVSPQPAPVVALPANAWLPANTPVAVSSVITEAETLLTADSLGLGFPNWGYAAAALVAMSFFGKKGKR